MIGSVTRGVPGRSGNVEDEPGYTGVSVRGELVKGTSVLDTRWEVHRHRWGRMG